MAQVNITATVNLTPGPGETVAEIISDLTLLVEAACEEVGVVVRSSVTIATDDEAVTKDEFSDFEMDTVDDDGEAPAPSAVPPRVHPKARGRVTEDVRAVQFVADDTISLDTDPFSLIGRKTP